MSARKLKSSDLTAVIENMSGGIGLEIAKLDLNNIVLNAQFEDESLSFADSEHLKKLSSHLLMRFGVDLAGYSKFKVAQAIELDSKLDDHPSLRQVGRESSCFVEEPRSRRLPKRLGR